MKTVKVSDVVTISKMGTVVEPGNIKQGDIYVTISGSKVYIVSPNDAERFNKTQQLQSGPFWFVRPTKITADEFVLLLPGLLSIVPYHGWVADFDVLKEILIPDLSVEAEFKKQLKEIKVEFELEGESILIMDSDKLRGAKNKNICYRQSVESLVLFFKPILEEINKA